MKIYSEKVFEAVKGLFRAYLNADGDYGWLDHPFVDVYGSIESHDGSSYDGFLSTCEGWVEWTAPFDPYRDFAQSGFRFSGVDDSSKLKAVSYNAYLEAMTDEDTLIKEYCEDYGLPMDFVSEEELLQWWNGKRFEDGYENTEVEEEIQRYLDTRWEDYPAFMSVKIIFHRNVASIYCTFNDDLGYGRERVGDWAGSSAIGHSGDHDIYSAEVTFGSLSELMHKAAKELNKAFACLNSSTDISDEEVSTMLGEHLAIATKAPVALIGETPSIA